MSTLPQTQMALVCHGVGKYALTRDARTPTPGASTVIVRTVTVSVQPHDWKMAEYSPTPGAVAGCDFAGVVVQAGSSVRAYFTEGDRVYGVVFGSNPLQPDRGAFCQYVEADPSLLAHIPPSISFEEAATLATGVVTVGMALYHCLGLPWPSRPLGPPAFVLVYGASSATGWYALQLVKLSGAIPVAVCSEKNHDLVRSLGVVNIFDRQSETCKSDIRRLTRGTLAYALDCISDSYSMEVCYAAMGEEGGGYLALEQYPPQQHTRRDIKPAWLMGLTIFGMPVKLKGEYGRPVVPEDRQFAQKWFAAAAELVQDGSIVPAPVLLRPGKFMGVLDGIEAKKKGNVSAGKLVYRVGTA